MDIGRRISAGGVDYVTKPSQVDEVLARVDAHAHQSRTQRQLVEKNIQLEAQVAELLRTEEALREEIDSDITERNRTEEELRKLSRAVEQSPSIVIITDTEANIEYVNPKFTEITGYEAGEVVGQNARFLKSGRQPLRFYKEMWDIIVADEEWRGEFDNRKKNGELYWERASISPVRNAEGVITHFIKVAEDITERKRAEEALQESEERYRSLFTTVPIGLYRSTPDGQLLDANPALTYILGYPDRESFLAINVADTYVNPQDRERWKAQIDRKDVVRDFEVQLRRRDGTMIWARSGARAIRDSDDQVVCYEGAMEDITDRKRAEEQLQRYAIELEQRNEELDAFAHTVAHDLQNPLGIIVGFASVLEEDSMSMSRKRLGEYLSAIVRNGQKMRDIIDALLLLAGVRNMEVPMGRIDMASIVVEAQQRSAFLIEEHQAEIVLPDNWPAAIGYAPWLEEVWANFISNAIKYGGRPPRVELGGEQQADGTVRLWIRDNGPGLAPEEQERLFRPFSRLHHTTAKGHGLGLSIVRRIVDRLGGQVRIESEVGRGSVFIFTLPGEV